MSGASRERRKEVEAWHAHRQLVEKADPDLGEAMDAAKLWRLMQTMKDAHPRRMEAVERRANGETRKEIGESWGLSTTTVEHVERAGLIVLRDTFDPNPRGRGHYWIKPEISAEERARRAERRAESKRATERDRKEQAAARKRCVRAFLTAQAAAQSTPPMPETPPTNPSWLPPGQVEERAAARQRRFAQAILARCDPPRNCGIVSNGARWCLDETNDERLALHVEKMDPDATAPLLCALRLEAAAGVVTAVFHESIARRAKRDRITANAWVEHSSFVVVLRVMDDVERALKACGVTVWYREAP